MISVFDKKDECCGCTACKTICPTKAIEMNPDEEGFLYPNINQAKCIDCGMCKRVCPFQNEVLLDGRLEEPIVYAVKHKDNQVRLESTSGGVYTEISNYGLKSSASIYGVRFDENFNVVHSRATNTKERNEFRGSKYVQSDLKDIFCQIQKELKSGKRVLFTGTGCQVAGLRMLLRDSKTDIDKLMTNDIICHGTPSPLLWKDYVDFIQRHKKLKSYTFRYKEIGWRGYNVKAEYDNGKTKINSSDLRVFTNLFSLDLALRPSCYNCKFCNTNRVSDIMIGDFWGIENIIPEINDNKGVSLVLINTPKGKNVFHAIRDNLDVWESNEQDCLQPNLISPTIKPLNRDQFWKEYHSKGYRFIYKKYGGYNLKLITKRYAKKILIKMRVLNNKK